MKSAEYNAVGALLVRVEKGWDMESFRAFKEEEIPHGVYPGSCRGSE
jgi:hypothetical protein